MTTYLPTTEKRAITSYPYGSQRTTAYFSLEHKAGKGFRTVFQTVNPKTGKLNAEKKSTYCPVIVMGFNDENNHYEYAHLSFYGYNGINNDCRFMANHFDLFTPEQIKDIYAYLYSSIKANVKGTVLYGGVELQKIKPHIDKAVNAVILGFKDGKNHFSDVVIDEAAIEAMKDPNFNPFKTSSAQAI